MCYAITARCAATRARVGVLTTNHGTVVTPSFFPVATQGAVKGLTSRDLIEIKVAGLLANAYHLYLRPGADIIAQAGGLHKFMGIDVPILSDSGGYQVFSLARLRKVTDEGVSFQSHIDGSSVFISPQEIMKFQLRMGADIVVPLDECIALPASQETAAAAVQRTIRWASLSKQIFDQEKSFSALFFPIVQGGVYPHLRIRCLESLLQLDPDGLAIGGLSVGEESQQRNEILDALTAHLEEGVFRYFMGYGKPLDILGAVELGIDLFDCVVPTRYARTGTAFTYEGEVVVRNAPFAQSSKPLDARCNCFVCRTFSRAYIRHLINVKEITAIQLLTYHNVWWYNTFIRAIQEAIRNNCFLNFKKEFLACYQSQQ